MDRGSEAGWMEGVERRLGARWREWSGCGGRVDGGSNRGRREREGEKEKERRVEDGIKREKGVGAKMWRMKPKVDCNRNNDYDNISNNTNNDSNNNDSDINDNNDYYKENNNHTNNDNSNNNNSNNNNNNNTSEKQQHGPPCSGFVLATPTQATSSSAP